MDPAFFDLKESGRVYLDHNATTPVASCVAEKLAEWVKLWGNPSSIHFSGRGPKAVVRLARQGFAEMISAHALEVIFTSGGSESNNLALKGIYFQNQIDNVDRNEYIISAVEHPSVQNAADFLEELGTKIHRVPVSLEGEFDLEFFKSVLSERTALVSVMFANNETGHVMPIKKIAKLTHEVGALLHCDAVQALGKTVVNVESWGVDLASFSGHKFYGLKGSGALYIRKGLNIKSLIHGGAQERRRRAGTENTMAIAALGEMTKFSSHIGEHMARVQSLRDELESLILKKIPGVRFTGQAGKRLVNTSHLVIEDIDGESLLMNLDVKGFSVSTGAACSSGSPEPSPVLLAMGMSRKEAQSSLRLSLGWGTTQSEIASFVETLSEVVVRLRKVHKEMQPTVGASVGESV